MIPCVNYVGLTVSSLDRSVAFYRDGPGLNLVLEQEKEGGYLSAITRYPGAHARMAQLEARGVLASSSSNTSSRPGVGSRWSQPTSESLTRVCSSTTSKARAAGSWRPAPEPFSDPVAIDTGANAGGWGVYVRDPDGIVLELFEPPIG